MIRPIQEDDDPSGFSCGSHELDDYLRRHALANTRAGVGITYVSESSGCGIAGYVTLAAATVRALELDQATSSACSLPGYPLPALLVARLAVDRACQGQGVGRALLTFSLGEALVARERIGCVGVLVDAKPDAVSFYDRFGFTELRTARSPGANTRMFLGMDTVVDSLRLR